ncbi:MAG: sensor histidine kinase [Actinomycetota bacterium]
MTRPQSWFSRLSPVAWLKNHPFVADLMVALVMTGIAVQGLWLANTGGLSPAAVYHRPDAFGVLLAVMSTLPIAWRRNRPEVVLGVVGCFAIMITGFHYSESSGGLGVLVAIYTVAAHCTSRRRSQLMLGFTLAGMLTALKLSPYDLPLNFLVSNTIIFVTAWVLGDNLQTRRRYVAELEVKAERLERDRAQDAQKAVAEERSRIARELHDVVAHNVSVMVVQAGGARRTLDRDPARAREVIESIEATGRQALTEMRRLLGVLRADDEATDARAPQPGVSRLDDLVEHVRSAGMPVKLRVQGSPVELAAGVDLSAYRIVQEALTNALKHAGPASAEVLLRYGLTDLQVTVRDNGRGSAAALTRTPRNGDAAGHGLAGMRERVSLFGGVLHAGPLRGGGYQVVATLPLGADHR